MMSLHAVSDLNVFVLSVPESLSHLVKIKKVKKKVMEKCFVDN